MLAEVGRRLLATVPVMGVVAIAVFGLLHVVPGDPAVIIAGDYATAEDVARIRSKLGLDRPFLTQVEIWLSSVVHGDLGTSIFSGLPVATLIKQRAEATVALTVLAMLISIGVGVPLGVLAAWRKGSWIDRLVMVLAVSGFSMPVFWLGFVPVYAFVRRDYPVVQGVILVVSGAYVLINLVVDLLYVVLDPRIRF